jgi:hypothetical protein
MPPSAAQLSMKMGTFSTEFFSAVYQSKKAESEGCGYR